MDDGEEDDDYEEDDDGEEDDDYEEDDYEEEDEDGLICNCRVFAGKAWVVLRKLEKCISKLSTLAFSTLFQ